MGGKWLARADGKTEQAVIRLASLTGNHSQGEGMRMGRKMAGGRGGGPRGEPKAAGTLKKEHALQLPNKISAVEE